MSPARKYALLNVSKTTSSKNVMHCQAFASFPYTTFIWKYEDKSDYFASFNASKMENIVLTDWMPQLDILG